MNKSKREWARIRNQINSKVQENEAKIQETWLEHMTDTRYEDELSQTEGKLKYTREGWLIRVR